MIMDIIYQNSLDQFRFPTSQILQRAVGADTLSQGK